MIREGSENKLALLILVIYIFFYHKNLTFRWAKTIENGGKSHYEQNVFLKYTLDMWGGEFERPKTLQGPHVENCGERLSFVEKGWVEGQTTFKKIVKQPLHHHVLFGRVSRTILLTHPKIIYSIFSCQTRLELQMGLASMVKWNKKKMLFSSKHSS